jgi:cytochrome b
MMRQGEGKQAVLVWDIPVRLFHWTLALLIGFLYLSQKMGWMQWHVYAGCATLALVLFRIVWGLIGSTHARFGDFLYGPGAIIGYIKTLPSRTAAKFAGHNPLGGISVVLILLCVLAQAVTGLLSNDDIAMEGPLVKFIEKDLSDWLTSIHRLNFNVLLALIAVHVGAVMYYLIYKKENLIRPMFTGRKNLEPHLLPARNRSGSLVVAAVVFVVLAGCAAYLANS